MSPTIDSEAPAEELPLVRGGRLPQRYAEPMQAELYRRTQPLLVPGVAILDVGAGRYPTLSPADRPSGCRYVGLDIEAHRDRRGRSRRLRGRVVADITQAPEPGR